MNLLNKRTLLKGALTCVLVFLLAFTSNLRAQESRPSWHFLDKASMPLPSAEMPDYVRPLYADQANYEAVVAGHKAYYSNRGPGEWREDLERDPYAKFYLHWIEQADQYADEDGVVRQLSTQDLLRFRAKAYAREQAANNTPAPKSGNTWEFVGPRRTVWRAEHRPAQQIAPWQVNIYSMAVAPSNPNRVVCGSETGAVYFSDDKGLNWTPILDYNFGRAILSVAINPNDQDEVYVGTSTDVLKTADGGVSWSVVLTGSGLSVNTLRFNESGSMLLAGTGQGVQQSTDGGANWTNILAGEVMDLAFKPGNNSTIYALMRESGPNQCMFYKSTNGGLLFSLSMTGWTPYADASGGRMDVTSANDDYIYVGLLTANNTPVILRSTSAGGSWTEVAQGNTTALNMDNGQGYYDLDIVVNDLNEQEVIFGTNTSYRSTDGGVNYTALGGYRGDFDIHPDIQEMVSIGGDTWITTDGGMNYSTDFYATLGNWDVRIDGLDGTNFWGYDQGWNEDYMIGGRYHNGNTALHENYPAQFALRMGGAESATGHAWHGKERYSIFDDISNTIIPYNFTDPAEGTFTFTKDDPNDYFYGSIFSNLLVDREDYETLYIGEGDDLWKTTDGGVSWESIHNFGQEVWSFDISRANPDVFYVVAYGGIHKSTDRGETFTQVATPPGVPFNRIWQMMVSVSGTDEDELWLMDKHANGTGSNNRPRVWYSNDGGSNWTSWHTGTLDGRQFRAFAHHVGSNGGVYVASSRSSTPGALPAKVYYRDKSMSEWVDCSAGLPASASVQKILPYYRDNVLRWAGNRGVWELPLEASNWAPIAQPFVNGAQVLCAGDPVEFDSYSVNKANATYSWSIPGAATVTSLNEREVSATFAAPGTYTATLTVSQSGGSDTKTLEIEVGDNCNPDPFPGNSVSLSGASSDFVVMDAPLGISTNTMTISGWIKPAASQVSTACIFFARGSSAFGLNYQSNTGSLSIHWNNSQWWWNSGLTPTPGEWNHVVMAVEPTRVTLYLNGIPAVRNFAAGVYTFDSPIAIGRDLTRGDRNFAGEVDEVVLYNRTLSQNEVRELMHLTRIPEDEVGVLAYYQFNRDEGAVTNRATGTHAKLAGGAVRTTSTAPVGPGASARQTVSAAGSYDFGDTGLTLDFAAGTTPNGELCVTRLDIQPDQLPAGPGIIDKYWVIHNYGTNQTFDELSSMTFDGVGPVAPGIEASPEAAELFKRQSNAHGNTWGTSVAAATAATAGADGSLTFGAGNSQTGFSQFIISIGEPVLGAELLTFNAEVREQKAVDLNWASAREENLDRYEIQRSADGNNFTSIGEVGAAINSETALSYDWRDESPLNGRSYYRLRMVDLDGTITFSDVRSVLLRGRAARVVVYPNPMSSGQSLNVVLQDDQVYTFSVFTSAGERVGTYEVSGEATLSLPDLPTGIYGWQIRGNDYRTQGMIVIK